MMFIAHRLQVELRRKMLGLKISNYTIGRIRHTMAQRKERMFMPTRKKSVSCIVPLKKQQKNLVENMLKYILEKTLLDPVGMEEILSMAGNGRKNTD